MIKTELDTGEERHNAFSYWSGIDCSGFIQRVVTKGKGEVPTAKIKIRDLTDTDNDRNMLDDNALGSWEFLDNADKTYATKWGKRNAGTVLKKIRRGDLIEYEGHVSTVYSDRPSNCVDKDGKTTCTYEIIHAYGVDKYQPLNAVGKKVGKPIFSRKVIKTKQNIGSEPTGFGRIKLWD